MENGDLAVTEDEREDSFSNGVTMAAVQSDAKGTPTDPGVVNGNFWEQWHHTSLYGLNTIPTWNDYTGSGIRVGVLDDGFNYNHSELSNNFRTDLDYDVLGNDSNSINDSNDTHGTYTSQVIGGDDNGAQGVGVAFDSDIVGIRRGFGVEGTSQDTLDAYQYAIDNNFDIINNSWGVGAAFADNKKINFVGVDTDEVIGKIEDAVEFGRGGLGMNVVFSSGNGRLSGSGANYKNYQNSPFTISVAATNESGKYAYFSDAGSNVLVTAPGENILVSNAADNGNGVLVSGTSFSAPAVSGVIALMLEANPALGYRDVQEILAMSSRQIDVGGTGWAGEGWQTNGATNWNGGGLHFSHDYGFGLVDALAATRLAETWNMQQTYTNMNVVSPISSAPSLVVPATGVVTTTINVASDIEIEHVLIDLDIDHSRAGDLVVTLISPDGTESVLMSRIDNGSYTTTYGVYTGVDFEFSSVAHWGESSAGIWTLRIEDQAVGNAGVLDDWSLSFLGNAHSNNDLYVYTNEYSGASGSETIISDSNGGDDTVNMAAVTGNVVVDLTSGGNIAGKAISVAGGTVIEDLYTGDGDDSLTGNNVDNLLYGGRGNDSFFGSDGNDTLDGAQGSDTAFYSFNIVDFVIGLVDSVTVTLTNSITSFVDTLRNIEFFDFSDASLSRSELDSYVATGEIPSSPPPPPPPPPPAPAPAEKTSIKMKGKGTVKLTHEETGIYNYTGDDLKQPGGALNILRVERGVTTFDLDPTNPGAFSYFYLSNYKLTDVAVHGITDTRLNHKKATGDMDVDITAAMKGYAYTGSGDDTVHINSQNLNASTKSHKWTVKTLGGDDDVSIDGGGVKTSTKIYLGEGNDTFTTTIDSADKVYADDGDDVVNTGDGLDYVKGGDGNDNISGGEDYDKLYGENGNDIIYAGEGDDRAYGGNDNDIIYGGAGNDRLYGDKGNDRLEGGAGDDRLYAGNDEDILIDGEGANKFYGSKGKDTFAFDHIDTELDNIYTFTLGEDVLNISDILTGYDSATDDLNDFAKIIDAGSKTYVEINEDGDIGGAFERIAVINKDFKGQTVDELLANGTLVADSII